MLQNILGFLYLLMIPGFFQDSSQNIFLFVSSFGIILCPFFYCIQNKFNPPSLLLFFLNYIYVEGIFRKWLFLHNEKFIYILKALIVIGIVIFKLPEILKSINFYDRFIKYFLTMLFLFLCIHSIFYIDHSFMQYSYAFFCYIFFFLLLFTLSQKQDPKSEGYMAFNETLSKNLFFIQLTLTILVFYQWQIDYQSEIPWINKGLELGENEARVIVNAIGISYNRRVLGTFTFLNWYYISCFIILYQLARYLESCKINIYLISASILSFTAIPLTGSRKVFVMLLIAISAAFFIFKDNKKYQSKLIRIPLIILTSLMVLYVANPKILGTTLNRIAGESNENIFNENTVSRSLDTINLEIGSLIGDGIGRRSSHAKSMAEIFKEKPLTVDWVNSIAYEEGHRNILGELGILGFIIYYGFHFSLLLFALRKCRIRERKFPLLVTAALFHIFTLYTTYSNVFFVTILVMLTYAAGFQFIFLHEKKLKP